MGKVSHDESSSSKPTPLTPSELKYVDRYLSRSPVPAPGENYYLDVAEKFNDLYPVISSKLTRLPDMWVHDRPQKRWAHDVIDRKVLASGFGIQQQMETDVKKNHLQNKNLAQDKLREIMGVKYSDSAANQILDIIENIHNGNEHEFTVKEMATRGFDILRKGKDSVTEDEWVYGQALVQSSAFRGNRDNYEKNRYRFEETHGILKRYGARMSGVLPSWGRIFGINELEYYRGSRDELQAAMMDPEYRMSPSLENRSILDSGALKDYRFIGYYFAETALQQTPQLAGLLLPGRKGLWAMAAIGASQEATAQFDASMDRALADGVVTASEALKARAVAGASAAVTLGLERLGVEATLGNRIMTSKVLHNSFLRMDRGMFGRLAVGFAGEGLTEFTESFTNSVIASVVENDSDILDGAFDAAVNEGFFGGLFGGGVSMIGTSPLRRGVSLEEAGANAAYRARNNPHLGPIAKTVGEGGIADNLSDNEVDRTIEILESSLVSKPEVEPATEVEPPAGTELAPAKVTAAIAPVVQDNQVIRFVLDQLHYVKEQRDRRASAREKKGEPEPSEHVVLNGTGEMKAEEYLGLISGYLGKEEMPGVVRELVESEIAQKTADRAKELNKEESEILDKEIERIERENPGWIDEAVASLKPEEKAAFERDLVTFYKGPRKFGVRLWDHVEDIVSPWDIEANESRALVAFAKENYPYIDLGDIDIEKPGSKELIKNRLRDMVPIMRARQRAALRKLEEEKREADVSEMIIREAERSREDDIRRLVNYVTNNPEFGGMRVVSVGQDHAVIQTEGGVPFRMRFYTEAQATAEVEAMIAEGGQNKINYLNSLAQSMIASKAETSIGVFTKAEDIHRLGVKELNRIVEASVAHGWYKTTPQDDVAGEFGFVATRIEKGKGSDLITEEFVHFAEATGLLTEEEAELLYNGAKNAGMDGDRSEIIALYAKELLSKRVVQANETKLQRIARKLSEIWDWMYQIVDQSAKTRVQERVLTKEIERGRVARRIPGEVAAAAPVTKFSVDPTYKISGRLDWAAILDDGHEIGIAESPQRSGQLEAAEGIEAYLEDDMPESIRKSMIEFTFSTAQDAKQAFLMAAHHDLGAGGHSGELKSYVMDLLAGKPAPKDRSMKVYEDRMKARLLIEELDNAVATDEVLYRGDSPVRAGVDKTQVEPGDVVEVLHGPLITGLTTDKKTAYKFMKGTELSRYEKRHGIIWKILPGAKVIPLKVGVFDEKERLALGKFKVVSKKRNKTHWLIEVEHVPAQVPTEAAAPVTKFSVADSEYMAAAEAGDTETAQRMKDMAAIDRGYKITAFHGSSTAKAIRETSTFDPEMLGKATGAGSAKQAFFFANSAGTSAEYAMLEAADTPFGDWFWEPKNAHDVLGHLRDLMHGFIISGNVIRPDAAQMPPALWDSYGQAIKDFLDADTAEQRRKAYVDFRSPSRNVEAFNEANEMVVVQAYSDAERETWENTEDPLWDKRRSLKSEEDALRSEVHQIAGGKLGEWGKESYEDIPASPDVTEMERFQALLKKHPTDSALRQIISIKEKKAVILEKIDEISERIDESEEQKKDWDDLSPQEQSDFREDHQDEIDAYAEEMMGKTPIMSIFSEIDEDNMPLNAFEWVKGRDPLDAGIDKFHLQMDNPKVVKYGSYRDEEFGAIIADAKKNGHDSVLFDHVRDGGGYDQIFAVFSPSQIKSADPITRDDDGNIIPLSERFDPAKADIRFGVEYRDPSLVVKDTAREIDPIVRNLTEEIVKISSEIHIDATDRTLVKDLASALSESLDEINAEVDPLGDGFGNAKSRLIDLLENYRNQTNSRGEYSLYISEAMLDMVDEANTNKRLVDAIDRIGNMIMENKRSNAQMYLRKTFRLMKEKSTNIKQLLPEYREIVDTLMSDVDEQGEMTDTTINKIEGLIIHLAENPSIGISYRHRKQMERLSKKSVSQLTEGDATALADGLNSLLMWNETHRKLMGTRNKVEIERVIAGIHSEILTTHKYSGLIGRLPTTPIGKVTHLEPKIRDMVIGLDMSTTLRDLVEILAGGSQTEAFQHLYDNIRIAQNSMLSGFYDFSDNMLDPRDPSKGWIAESGISEDELALMSETFAKQHNEILKMLPLVPKRWHPSKATSYDVKVNDTTVVKMTAAERMGLYASLKDEGFYKNVTKRGVKIRLKDRHTDTGFGMTEKDVINFRMDVRLNRQSEVALVDKAVDYLNTTLKTKMREWSLVHMGHDITRDGVYYSTHRADGGISTEQLPSILDEMAYQSGSILVENAGLAKDRQEGSKQDYVVGDFFDEISTAAWVTNSVVNLSPALKNAKKIIDDPGIRNMFKDSKRSDAVLERINNTYVAIATESLRSSPPRGVVEGRLLSKWKRNVTIALLSYNPRVMLYQPASLIISATEFKSREFLYRAMSSDAWLDTSIDDDIRDWSPALRFRMEGPSHGIVSEDIGTRIKDSVGQKKKRPEELGMRGIRWFDSMAIRVIWRAAEAQARSEGKEGDAVKARAAVIAEDIVRKTQPTFWALDQSGLQLEARRSQVANLMTFFRSQKVKNQSTSYRRYWEYRRGEITKAQFVRDIAEIYVAQSLWISAVRSGTRKALKLGGVWLFGIGLDDDDERDDGYLGWVKNLVGEMADVALGNFIGGEIPAALIKTTMGVDSRPPSISNPLSAMAISLTDTSFTLYRNMSNDKPTNALWKAEKAIEAFLYAGGIFKGMPGIAPFRMLLNMTGKPEKIKKKKPKSKQEFVDV